MKRSPGRRPASGRPRTSHRRPRARLSRPALSLRLVTAAGFAALLGVGIAVGAGALQMPLSARTTKATTATDPLGAGAMAVIKSIASPESFALATLPRGLAAHDPEASHSPSRKATARSTPRRTVTPTASPSSPRPAYTPTPAYTSAPAHSPQPAESSPPPSSSGLTPQPTAENQTPTGSNELAWSEAILTALGDPLTSANIVSMGYWMQNEAGSPPSGIVGANNPINVSEPGYGGTPIQYEAPGYYLMSYPTVQDGVQATAAYLNNGSYPGILADLQAGTGLNDPNLASELQEYSGGGYSTIPDSWGASQGTPES